MPKHTRAPNHHRYSNPIQVPVTVGQVPTSGMAYYDTRAPMSGYYEQQPPASAAEAAMPPLSYESYSAGHLALPASAGGPVGGGQGPVPDTSGLPLVRPSSGAWTAQDDQTLVHARASGQNWAQIKANFFPSKTGNACRKRHERLMERRGADDWDTRKMERMSKEYISMRKEIWQPLAQRCGEKWNVVEQKCMSNGLKNIQSHARSYSRRERIETGQPLPSYDDDSGISGMGLTPVDDEHSYSNSDESPSSAAARSSGAATSGGGRAAAAYSTAMAQGSYQGYGYGPPPGPHHGYTSSVSSTGTVGYGSAGQAGHGVGYAGRMPSIDMGIDSLINRGPGGRGI